MRKIVFHITVLLTCLIGDAIQLRSQETNSLASGTVYSQENEILAGATITLVHEPTQNNYLSVTDHNGSFRIFNVKPGGPYTIIISSAEHETIVKNNLFISLTGMHLYEGEKEITRFQLRGKSVALPEAIVISSANNKWKTGTETNISRQLMNNLPSINRSFDDYIRLIPQAKVGGEGSMSLAGQNNRFNAVFVDGANNTDLQGLSINGMNGGQTGSPPVSMEAIQEINVSLAPYDVQYGHFTGGIIHAVTRSGSNTNQSAAWYYFRNENLAGRSPQKVEKPGLPGVYHRPRLSEFFNQIFGVWNSGAIKKNELFYFILLERQLERSPQYFNLVNYRGNSNTDQLLELASFTKTQYGYNPGSFVETNEQLSATRINFKLDWNASEVNKFMVSYRLNQAVHAGPRLPSGSTTILFSNNGIVIPAVTHAASFEWRHFFKSGLSNRMLVSFTEQDDDRERQGTPFPVITIADGPATIVLGSEASTGSYRLKAIDYNFLNVLKWSKDRHFFTLGSNFNITVFNNRYTSAFFGAYTFPSVQTFLSGGQPVNFNRSFSIADETVDPARYRSLKSSLFINDFYTCFSRFSVNFGLRLDANAFPDKPQPDAFFDDTAILLLGNYYDLNGASASGIMKNHVHLSPRMGLEFRLSKGFTLKGGGGIFLGRINNQWISDVFNNRLNGIININPQQFGLGFIPDPYNQHGPSSVNMSPSDFKGSMIIMDRKFKYPSVFRTSLGIEKRFKKQWTVTGEVILTKNINEVLFRNVNILPPVKQTIAPDVRNVYSTGSAPVKVPLKANGQNPYSAVFLITNNDNRKGYAYNLAAIVKKQSKNFLANVSYSYGLSRVMNEITGPQTPVFSQWRNIETVNGRNFISRSVSDNDMGHRISAWFSKSVSYNRNTMGTVISIYYNGQSGTPFSYVYNGSIINDNGNRETYDLVYIPRENDLLQMQFLPIRSANGNVIYTVEQQKTMLNQYIQNDPYLSRHRGEYAKRNGARLPFTHMIDLKIQQKLQLPFKGKSFNFTVSYDVFNLTNMLYRNWGRIYFLPVDSYPLITFAGYASTSPLVPQYQFRPFNGNPWSLHPGSVPGNSPRWTSQLGVKIDL